MGRIDRALQRAARGEDLSALRAHRTGATGDGNDFDVTEPVVEGPSDGARFRERPSTRSSSSRPLPVSSVRIPSPAADEIRVWDVVQALRRRWVLVVAIIVASVTVAMVYNTVATPLYEARARIIIEPSSAEVVTFRPVGTEDQRTEEYFQTQVQVLRSRALAEKTLEKVGAPLSDTPPQGDAVADFMRSLDVTAVPGSRLVDVTALAKDPELSARAANAHAEAYLERNLETIARPSREASQWLTERLAELRKQVDSSQSALQQYREDRNAIPLEDRQNIDVQKLGQLSEAVTRSRTERIAKQALFDQLRSMQAGNQPLDSFPAILANSFIQQLKSELARLQRERAQLGEQLGDLHPDMVKVDTEIAEAERRLRVEIDSVLESTRNDFSTAQANERGLLAALAAQQQSVIASNRSAIGYGALQRDAASTQQIFEGVLQRFKEADLSAELQSNNVRILDAAVAPRRPVWPRTYLNATIALFGGLFAAIALALGMEFLNRRVESPEDIGEHFGVPLLGVAPRVAGSLKQLEGPDSSVPTVFREALRDLRARILLSPLASGVRMLVVTSTTPAEGKTVVANNLAVSMAMAGRRVLLVDADMRRPRLHDLHGVSRTPGLSDALVGSASIDVAVQRTAVEGLFLLPAGAPVANPADLLETNDVRAFLESLQDRFDLILIDSPPVMPVADASILANAAGAALFVVGAGSLRRETIQAAIARLHSVQTDVIGVVLNKAHQDRDAQYGYGYEASDIRGNNVRT